MCVVNLLYVCILGKDADTMKVLLKKPPTSQDTSDRPPVQVKQPAKVNRKKKSVVEHTQPLFVSGPPQILGRPVSSASNEDLPSVAARPQTILRPKKSKEEVANAIMERLSESNKSRSHSHSIPESYTLVNLDYLEFNAGLLNIHDTPCLVIGVLGRDRVGKTTLIHSLVSYTNIASKLIQPTRQIDFYVSPERAIYLDTPAIIKGKLKTEKADQIITFILSVCHIVLLVSDTHEDFDLWDHVKQVANVKYENTKEQGFVPRLVHVVNKQGKGMMPENMKRSRVEFASYFAESRLVFNDLGISKYLSAYPESEVDFMALPMMGNEKKGLHTLEDLQSPVIYRYTTLIQILRRCILRIEKHDKITDEDGSDAYVLKKWFRVTEREWLKNAGLVWDQISVFK